VLAAAAAPGGPGGRGAASVPVSPDLSSVGRLDGCRASLSTLGVCHRTRPLRHFSCDHLTKDRAAHPPRPRVPLGPRYIGPSAVRATCDFTCTLCSR